MELMRFDIKTGENSWFENRAGWPRIEGLNIAAYQFKLTQGGPLDVVQVRAFRPGGRYLTGGINLDLSSMEELCKTFLEKLKK